MRYICLVGDYLIRHYAPNSGRSDGDMTKRKRKGEIRSEICSTKPQLFKYRPKAGGIQKFGLFSERPKDSH